MHCMHANDVLYVLQALERKVGERVSATVGKLVDYGALLRFEVEVDADYMCEVWGLLHHSKMGRLVLESLQVQLLATPILLTQ